MPEQFFPAPEGRENEGISTVKAFELALAGGQRLYEIRPDNIGTTLGAINLDSETIADISQAVAAGKHVVVHTDEVSVFGWSGAGYAVIDPVTGDAAYLISGGANGGFVFYLLAAILLYLLMAWLIWATLTVVAANGIFALGLLGLSVFEGISIGNDLQDILSDCSGLELAVTLFIYAIIAIIARSAPGPSGAKKQFAMAIAAAVLAAFVPKPESAC